MSGDQNKMAKVFYEEEVNGETVLRNYTTTANALPFAVMIPTRPGIGKKFWSWPSVSNVSQIIGADFTDAPTVQNTAALNLAAINAITQTPADVLIWSTPSEE